jgi:hypothetical protein
MPRHVIVRTGGARTMTGMTPTQLQSFSSTSNGGGCATAMCSLEFFETLTDKLVCMVTSLQEQFEECHAAAQPQYAEGFVLVEVEIPKQTLGVKLEYLEYIKRYGPPCDGKFCEEKLRCLRAEMGLDLCNTTC